MLAHRSLVRTLGVHQVVHHVDLGAVGQDGVGSLWDAALQVVVAWHMLGLRGVLPPVLAE